MNHSVPVILALRQGVPSRAVVMWHHRHLATTLSCWAVCMTSSASSREGKGGEKQLSLAWTSGDAQVAPAQLPDCELQTQDVKQINSLLFKAMFFIASQQKPCKRLTHNHSNIWLEIRKIKPGGISYWKLLFFFSRKQSQRDLWNTATGSEGQSNCPEDIWCSAQFWQ